MIGQKHRWKRKNTHATNGSLRDKADLLSIVENFGKVQFYLNSPRLEKRNAA